MQKTCNKCHKEFKLVKQELAFYKELGLPQPTYCPTCRQLSRESMRSERIFFKYPCAKCSKDMVTTHNPQKGLIVYCLDCYKEFRETVDLTQI